MQEQKCVMGLWKFSDKISTKDLGEIASQWTNEDSNYLQLYIRKVSKNQMGIGFTYQLPADQDVQDSYNEYFSRTTDFLKRKFGNDIVGWDVGSPVWIIKDANFAS